MPCYKPLSAYRSESELTSTGKRKIVFNAFQKTKHGNTEASSADELSLPCGQCIGCRLERSRQWAIRCMHEAQLHENNSFITLTISDDQSHLPLQKRISTNTLRKSDFQRFMKRLRDKRDYRADGHIGYYYCGEYGEKYQRPHYHACLFNCDFPDKYLYKITDTGEHLFRSPELEKLWPYGFSTIGNVTFESAAYVARYITKKITGEHALSVYGGSDNIINKHTGEILDDHTHLIVEKERKDGTKYFKLQMKPELTRVITYDRFPEYTDMSKNPAIGLNWIKKYHTDVYPSDELILRGKKIRPARYYDKFYSEAYSEKFDEIKQCREDKIFELQQLHPEEFKPERMLVKHEIALRRIKKLKRSLEQPSATEFNSHKLDYDQKVINYQKGILHET